MFKKGDRVKLKSGGPVMTVRHTGDYSPLHSEDGVDCVWFDDKNKVCSEIFDAAMLEAA